MKDNKELVILAGKGGGGGDSGTDANAVHYTADSNKSDSEKAAARANIGAELATTVNTVSGATPTIEPAANNVYNCGELTSLTVTNPAETGEYSIVFTSGSTPTTTTIPSSILGLENFSAEANTLYEINVLDNRAVIGKWATA